MVGLCIVMTLFAFMQCNLQNSCNVSIQQQQQDAMMESLYAMHFHLIRTKFLVSYKILVPKPLHCKDGTTCGEGVEMSLNFITKANIIQTVCGWINGFLKAFLVVTRHEVPPHMKDVGELVLDPHVFYCKRVRFFLLVAWTECKAFLTPQNQEKGEDSWVSRD